MNYGMMGFKPENAHFYWLLLVSQITHLEQLVKRLLIQFICFVRVIVMVLDVLLLQDVLVC